MPTVQWKVCAAYTLQNHGLEGLIQRKDIQILIGTCRLARCLFVIALSLVGGWVDLHAIDANTRRADPLRQAHLVMD